MPPEPFGSSHYLQAFAMAQAANDVQGVISVAGLFPELNSRHLTGTLLAMQRKLAEVRAELNPPKEDQRG